MIVAFAVSTVALTAVLASGWLLLSLRRSQDRIADRVEAAARRLAAKHAVPTAPTVPASPSAAATSEPVRMAQDFALPDLDGRIVVSARPAGGRQADLAQLHRPQVRPLLRVARRHRRLGARLRRPPDRRHHQRRRPEPEPAARPRVRAGHGAAPAGARDRGSPRAADDPGGHPDRPRRPHDGLDHRRPPRAPVGRLRPRAGRATPGGESRSRRCASARRWASCAGPTSTAT